MNRWLDDIAAFASTARRGRCAALALALAAGALLAGCAASPATTRSREGDVAELGRRSDAWDKAIVAKNEAAIAANMADDFRIIDADADVEDKKAFVAGLLDPALRLDPYTVEEFEVRLYGDVALLSGRLRMTGSYRGKPFASASRYIDVYVRKPEGWRIVSVQITRMPAPP